MLGRKFNSVCYSTRQRGSGLEFINISGIVVTRASDWH